MASAVFVLGAGSSAPFGVPTLAQIFQDYSARRHLENDSFLRGKLLDLFWRPRGCDLTTSHLSLSVEEILTLVRDHEKQTYGAPQILEDESERFRRSLYVLIKKAVYDDKHSRGSYLNPILAFARERFSNVTWASFNWDCVFEASFYYSSSAISFERSNPKVVVDLRNWWGNSFSSHTFLKLHGGINWWYEDNALRYLPFGASPDLNEKWAAFERGEGRGWPVILEPSYYKYQDPVYEHLLVQWHYFVQRLLDADLVVILGYSLPEADSEARRALSIGFQSNRTAKFVVVNCADWTCDRYEHLFGTERLWTIRSSLEDTYHQLPHMIANYLWP